MLARRTFLLDSLPLTIAYLPLGSAVMLEHVKGTDLWIKMANPLALLSNEEWNTWLTHLHLRLECCDTLR